MSLAEAPWELSDEEISALEIELNNKQKNKGNNMSSFAEKFAAK